MLVLLLLLLLLRRPIWKQSLVFVRRQLPLALGSNKAIQKKNHHNTQYTLEDCHHGDYTLGGKSTAATPCATPFIGDWLGVELPELRLHVVRSQLCGSLAVLIS